MKDQTNKIILAVLAALAVFAIVFTIISQNKPASETADGAAQEELISRSSDVLEAVLRVYYVNYGSYPFTIDRLEEDVENNPTIYDDESDTAFITDSIDRLDDLDYSVKGDQSAYKYTYTNTDGETVTVEGNYENDYL